MQGHPSTGLKPTHRTGRTAALFKPRAPRGNASFSPITILRPMASYLRAQATSTTTTPTSLLEGVQKLGEQSKAAGSKDHIHPTVYYDGQPASITDRPDPRASEDHINAGRHQNLTTFSTPKVPFLNRKLDRSRIHRATPGIHEEPRTESEVSSSSSYLPDTTGANGSKFWTATLRTRTISSKSGCGCSQEELPTENSLPVSSSQGTRARSDDSLESGVSNQRVVGRGGSGSRPRVVIAEDQMPSFDIPTRKGSLPPDQQPALRPSGRGGFASRPQPLAPPVLPNLLSNNHNSHLRSSIGFERDQFQAEPLFVRPTGRGGAGSRAKISTKKSPTGANSTSSQSSSLLARLQIRKLRSQLQREQQKQKGKSPETSYGVHPLRDSMAYRITNGSSLTLSTIQFNADPQPPPLFFPDKESGHKESIHSHFTLTSLASEDMSWTPTNTFSSSNSDCVSSTSVNETPDDESQLDTYYIEGGEELQETRPTTPTYHHQRTLDKLTRTLGEAPTLLHGPREQARSKLAIKTAITSSRLGRGKTKGARRANISLSVSSIFMRPRRGSTASESTLASASDDLPLSNRSRRSDALSESWGLARDSYSTSPGSPMIFSAPSPSRERRQSQLSSPHMLGLDKDVDEGGEGGASAIAIASADAGADPVTLTGKLPNSDSDEAISPLSPVLSRSQSATLSSASMRTLQWQTSHAQSASMSALDAGQHLMPDEPPSPAQALPPKSHPRWLFPPDDPSDNLDSTATAFSAMLKRQRHETAISMESNEQGWTGEWNNDLQDVIRGLRSLH